MLEVATRLRSDLTLPLSPAAVHSSQVYTDLHVPVRLPRWHCPFRGCRSCDVSESPRTNHQEEWWSHVWSLAGHMQELRESINKHGLPAGCADIEETAFAVLLEAMATLEREAMPMIGFAGSKDRFPRSGSRPTDRPRPGSRVRRRLMAASILSSGILDQSIRAGTNKPN